MTKTRCSCTERKAKRPQCKMKTYGGFLILAGPPPLGVKPERCRNVALANGFCEKHDPAHW